MSDSGENLLRVICDDKLTPENIKTYSAFINYSKDSNGGYLTPLMNALHHKKEEKVRNEYIQ